MNISKRKKNLNWIKRVISFKNMWICSFYIEKLLENNFLILYGEFPLINSEIVRKTHEIQKLEEWTQ